MLDQFVEVFADRTGYVESDQILQAKQSCLGTTDERPQDGVGLFNRVLVVQHVAERHRA